MNKMLKSIDVSLESSGKFRVKILDPQYKGNHPYVYCSDTSLLDIIVSNLSRD